VVRVEEMLGAEAGKELVEFAVNKYIDNFVSKKYRDNYIKTKTAPETPTSAMGAPMMMSPMITDSSEPLVPQKSKGSFRKAMSSLFGSSKRK
jgi:hypothetical protein